MMALATLPLLAGGRHPARAADAPLRAVADVETPKRTEHVEPLYPAEARAAGVESVVLVGFTVDVEGRVTEPVVLSGHVLLRDPALAAVRQWRYRPTRVDGREVPVRMVETVPFWLGKATRPQGWPAGSFGGSESWITWPSGERARLKLLALESEELQSPSTPRVYRGTVKNISGKPLRKALAAALSRESLCAPQKTIAQELGDLEPGEERSFELSPDGHQADIVFGQVVEGDLRPVAALRQVKSMARVLPSRPILHDRIEACLEPRSTSSPAADEMRTSADPPTGLQPVESHDRPLSARKVTRPEYVEQAFDAGVEGTVFVELLVSTTGHVECARVLRSLPGTGLDAAALKTVYGWRFEPAIKNGRPVPTSVHAPVTFRIY